MTLLQLPWGTVWRSWGKSSSGVFPSVSVGAEAAGDRRFATFFRDVQKTYAEVAERAEKMLVDGSGRFPAGVQPGSEPAQRDPGDVSPDQEAV